MSFRFFRPLFEPYICDFSILRIYKYSKKMPSVILWLSYNYEGFAAAAHVKDNAVAHRSYPVQKPWTYLKNVDQWSRLDV